MRSLPALRCPPFRLAGVLLATLATGWAQDATKNYHLFVGLDLLLPREGDQRAPVENLTRTEAVVANGTTFDRINMRNIPAFSWARSPKVSRSPITIEGLQTEKAYTLGSDAAMGWMETQNTMAIYQQEKAAAAQMEAGEAFRVSGAVARTNQIYAANERFNGRQLVGNPETADRGLGQAGITELATTPLEQATQQAFMDSIDGLEAATDSTFFADRTQDGIVGGKADVLELEFEIASREPVADAYVVIMGKVTQESGEGVVTFHENVGAVGPEPRRIKIRKLGFEPGFDIKDVSVHVYSNGKELGTNLSEKNFALTRDQAREYLLLTHIAEHQFDTVAPTPVWELMPPVLLSATDRKAFNYPVVVNIDADGSVISIHDDETSAREFLNEIHEAAALRNRSTPRKAGASLGESVRVAETDPAVSIDQTGRLPPRIVTTIQEMIFLPAIDLGAPQAGTTRINLADFFR